MYRQTELTVIANTDDKGIRIMTLMTLIDRSRGIPDYNI